ncbi:hypothetical protein CMV_002089 [Castanea mollissima]|uniref:SHSP domain-containing protein n=1 Tax=Castanea mollissima TaxID=60419 RepID=A0A8J4RV36_9ROSI|nr:hypothetical protein CMV_002089 [Castanea mollissima]
MELELGLKITQTRGDLTSTTDFRIAKDRAGPVFLSRENDTMFILTAHLKGFKREKIDIKINEDGTRIVVSGEKPVQEMVMIGWVVYKKRVEVRGFRKVFKIPEGVVLDQIKAKFNEEESSLTIVMPKLKKGTHGVGIEEVQEEEVERDGKGKLEMEQVVANEVFQKDCVGEKIQEEPKEPKIPRIEETGGVVKETDRRLTEKTEIVEEIIKNDTTAEKSLEEPRDPRMKSEEEPHQTAEEKPDKGGLEEAKPVPTEFPKIANGDLNEKVGQEKPGTVQTIAYKREKETRQVAETSKEAEEIKQVTETSKEAEEIKQVTETSEKAKEITYQIELEEAAPEKVETYTAGEFGQAKHKISQEKQKPDQEPQRAETLQHDKDEVKKREETHGVGNEIQEASNKSSQEKEGESFNEEKPKELGEKATQTKQPTPERSKLCTPLLTAGSAVLVTLIVLVVHRLRAKKR